MGQSSPLSTNSSANSSLSKSENREISTLLGRSEQIVWKLKAVISIAMLSPLFETKLMRSHFCFCTSHPQSVEMSFYCFQA